MFVLFYVPLDNIHTYNYASRQETGTYGGKKKSKIRKRPIVSRRPEVFLECEGSTYKNI